MVIKCIGIVLLLLSSLLSFSLYAQSDLSTYFISRKYIWFMGGDLYPRSRITELKTLEDRNLVIPNVRQRTPGWPGSYRDIYFNLADMRAAIARGLSSSSVQIVIYDPEQYTDHRTPAAELENPIAAVKAFASAAHAKGLIAAYAPSCSLIQNGAMNIWRGRDPTRPAYWTTCADNLWSKAAPYVDLLDLQVQGIQRQVSEYTAAVMYAAREIRASNPRVKILAQLSTQIPSASTESIYLAASAVHTAVDGFYLSYRWTDPSDQLLIESFLKKVVHTLYVAP